MAWWNLELKPWWNPYVCWNEQQNFFFLCVWSTVPYLSTEKRRWWKKVSRFFSSNSSAYRANVVSFLCLLEKKILSKTKLKPQIWLWSMFFWCTYDERAFIERGTSKECNHFLDVWKPWSFRGHTLYITTIFSTQFLTVLVFSEINEERKQNTEPSHSSPGFSPSIF